MDREIHLVDTEGPCFRCSKPTRFWDISFGDYFCSSDCLLDEEWEFYLWCKSCDTVRFITEVI